jgi:hypothetical protein
MSPQFWHVSLVHSLLLKLSSSVDGERTYLIMVRRPGKLKGFAFDSHIDGSCCGRKDVRPTHMRHDMLVRSVYEG